MAETHSAPSPHDPAAILGIPPPETPIRPAASAYRPDIDGLRAIAVVSVVVYHAFPRLAPGGFIGVDIFFVISGFLISKIIFESLGKNSFKYSEFYARRIRRIFPALVLVMAAAFVAGWYTLLADEFRQLGKHAMASAAFVANLALWQEAGYFDRAAETKPFLHLWSLAVEEQFYIFWPMALGWIWRRRRRHVLLWITGAAALSFLVNVCFVTQYPDAAFYSPLPRGWEFAAGALLALAAPSTRRANSTFSRHAASALGLLTMVVGVAVIDRSRPFPGWWAVLPVLGASLTIWAGPTSWLNQNVLGSRVLVWIGLISYPLYLWHWPLLAYGRIVAGDTPTHLVRLAAVGIGVLLAWLTHRFIERYLRHRRGPWVVGGLIAGALTVTLCGGLAMARWVSPRQDDPGLQAVIAATSDWVFPDGMQAVTWGGERVFQVGHGKEHVLILGDSHAEQFAPRAVELAREQTPGLSTVYFGTLGGCPPVPHLFNERIATCGEDRDKMLALATGPGVDTVVLAACWTCMFQIEDASAPEGYYFLDGDVRQAMDKRGTEQGMAALETFLRSLHAAGKQVYLVLTIPIHGGFEPKVRIKGSRLGSMFAEHITDRTPMPTGQRQLNERMRQLATAAGAQVIDPTEALCTPHGDCLRSDVDGSPIYKDGSHLRARYVRRAATFLDVLFLSRATRTGASPAVP